jgi:peptidoglycan/LPS O-acetylase OafA/YrhL
MKYRSEIDGLRALAVMPVILFHAGFELFSGGFVGVDIFFVISGYLITTILVAEIENQQFSLISFYERRARRILPALFFVMLISIPFAWFWMLPDPFENFGQSLVGSSLFSNNILLIMTSGDYWGLEAEYKPLLHTWSLAVEEQYYILFPIFLILFWHLGRVNVFWIIVILAILSLSLSEWGWRNVEDANFFLSPMRIWELLAGSIAAFIAEKRGVQNNNLPAFLGLFAIVFSIIAYDETVPFPSVYSLVPVLGTVLLVLYAGKDTFVAKLLSTKAFVGIGLISYSMYLWHQPVLAFLKIYLKSPPNDFANYAVIFLTVILAIGTWRFVEQPFRQKGKFSSKFILRYSLVMIFSFVTLGMYIDRSNGIPERIFSDGSYKRNSHEIKITPTRLVIFDDVFSNIGKTNRVLIFGDSFAVDVAYLIEHKHPSLSYELIKSRKPQDTVCQMELWKNASSLNISSIIFAYDEGFDISCIETTIETLKASQIDILFVGTKQFGSNLNWIARTNFDERKLLCQPPITEKIKIDSRDQISIPSPHYYSFINEFSEAGCFPISNLYGEILSSDRYHFTVAGVEFFADSFFKNQNVKRVLDL